MIYISAQKDILLLQKHVTVFLNTTDGILCTYVWVPFTVFWLNIWTMTPFKSKNEPLYNSRIRRLVTWTTNLHFSNISVFFSFSKCVISDVKTPFIVITLKQNLQPKSFKSSSNLMQSPSTKSVPACCQNVFFHLFWNILLLSGTVFT